LGCSKRIETEKERRMEGDSEKELARQQSRTWKSTNATGAPYVLCIFNFRNPGHLTERVGKKESAA
jgi:hypothetical protein